MREIFLEEDQYQTLIKSFIPAIQFDGPFADSLQNEIKIALGEKCNIWPISIKEDAERAAIEDRERDATSQHPRLTVAKIL